MGKYTVTHLGPVTHDGKDYAEGEAIELDDKAAAAAMASGALVDAAKAKAEAKAKAKADAQPTDPQQLLPQA